MKPIQYNEEKDKFLQKERGISFKDIVKAIEKEDVVKTIDHPNRKKYPNQKMFLAKIDKYIILVPFVEEENFIFLKTIFPSRKYTKKYIKK